MLDGILPAERCPAIEVSFDIDAMESSVSKPKTKALARSRR
jgi:hypothetical protein